MSPTSNVSTDSKNKHFYAAGSVVMVFPKSFHSNPETQDSNAFQKVQMKADNNLILQKAQSEFLFFQKKLTEAGIQIHSFSEDTSQSTPDALFPNNWFCHMPDGRVFLFPMQAINRRREVRSDIIDSIPHSEVIDMTNRTERSQFLEGTGSVILDHQNKMAYACLSPRTSIETLNEFSVLSGYRLITFKSCDQNNTPIYHTNVMMALSPKTAVINLESIQNPLEKAQVVQALKSSGRQIVDITFEQMNQFAGNILFLKNKSNKTFWVCSEKAYNAFTRENKFMLQQDGELLYAPLDTIETYGGGGARCLLAEIF